MGALGGFALIPGVSGLVRFLGMPDGRPVRCLAIGAHPDDIEIGAGGCLRRLTGEQPDAELSLVILSGSADRAAEARSSGLALGGEATKATVTVLDGRDGHLPYDAPAQVKAALASAVAERPDLVLVHRADDAHQDHRFAADLAWQLFRSSTILEYEVPKWDGDLGRVNLYVPLSAPVADAKIDHLMRAFPSQRDRDWYTPDTFRAVLRLRGVECRAPSGYAEGFVARKLVV